MNYLSTHQDLIFTLFAMFHAAMCFRYAEVAELVDALDSGSSGE